ncbi:adhesion G-protein coupled receptor G2-like [Scomber japonicus]|uniref:adhesion G-protein coupled receptor G2-like n=1 Tax=Scomber japonicus TaxID=13676 RepID=UPI002306C0D6|nr:adhesion G-protein coupled receptor G2-like [Scomber japonicus]
MKWWFLYWLIQSLVSHILTGYDPMDCMIRADSYLTESQSDSTIKAVERLEDCLDKAQVTENTPICFGRFVAFMHKPKGPFKGLKLYASETEAMSEKAVANSTLSVQLPSELDVGSNNSIVFCVLTWPEKQGHIWGSPGVVHGSKLIGLSVGKTISGLQERVNITMNLTMGVNETEEPSCVFFNFTEEKYSSNGCLTLWKRGQSQVTCSCDHLTYFGVLLVSASLSPTNQKVLTYISLIGCSISLFALVITVLLFISKRNIRGDVSMKVHINLAIALILLNLHFLPSDIVASNSSRGVCLYMALLLHYSLLATFCWMAVEGFHLYLLIVRVFNIYVRKYLLKLSLVGWGVPAVIVSLVVIIDTDAYGRVPLDSSEPNSTAICYIGNDIVKMVTTVGMFGLVFSFNLIMFGVAIRRVVSPHHIKKFGQTDRDRAKRDICTLLGVSTLLGITWGLIFFSFGHLTTPGLYLFCVINSLQGFFIFLWFVMSLRKIGHPSTTKSIETRSTNSR